jgi:predicted DNA-binding protein
MAASELLSIRVEPELAERVKVEASRDRRTVSTFVRLILADTLAGKRKRAPENRESAA